jgi:hypothetical protein
MAQTLPTLSRFGRGRSDRHLVRTSLFRVALPFGLVAGLATGIAVGVWYGRGGRLPRDRTPLEL